MVWRWKFYMLIICTKRIFNSVLLCLNTCSLGLMLAVCVGVFLYPHIHLFSFSVATELDFCSQKYISKACCNDYFYFLRAKVLRSITMHTSTYLQLGDRTSLLLATGKCPALGSFLQFYLSPYSWQLRPFCCRDITAEVFKFNFKFLIDIFIKFPVLSCGHWLYVFGKIVLSTLLFLRCSQVSGSKLGQKS